MIVDVNGTRYNLTTIKVLKADYLTGLEEHFSDPAMMKHEANVAKDDGPRVHLIDLGLAGIDPTLLGDKQMRVPQSGHTIRIEGDESTMTQVVEFVLKGWGRRDLRPGEMSPIDRRAEIRKGYAIAASDRRALERQKHDLARPIVVQVPTFEIMTEEEAIRRRQK